MKRIATSPLALPFEALLLQGLAALALWFVADLAYGDPQARIPHALERPAALAAFALGGLAAGALVVAGLYRLFRDHALSRAIPATLAYVAPLFIAALSTWALWFLA